jgi:hypothetical protein
MADKVAVVRGAVDAWNAHDRDRYVTAYQPEVKLHGFPGGVDDAATSAISSPGSGKPSRTPGSRSATRLRRATRSRRA